MNISHIYHTTSLAETLESHVYVDRYSDVDVKEVMHRYKFNQDSEAEHRLIHMTLDLCLDTLLHDSEHAQTSLYVYTSPPSTMYERGEKKVDSMFSLLHKALSLVPQYVHTCNKVNCTKIFSIHSKHLQKKKAQHLGGNRKSRTTDLEKRYYISLRYKLYLWYCIHVRKIQHFYYVIIDDVSSTGGTLTACKQTLLTYLKHIQKKNPHVSFCVKIFSLTH